MRNSDVFRLRKWVKTGDFGRELLEREGQWDLLGEFEAGRQS